MVDILTLLSTSGVRRKLKNAGVTRILVDNTVLAHAITHESAWVDTGRATAGNLTVDTGYMARIPVHDEGDGSDAGRSVRYLPGIASLARRGHLRLANSDELLDEQWTQPAGRFTGYGYYDHSLFYGVEFERIRDPYYSITIGSSSVHFPSMEEQRKKRLDAKTDDLFWGLVSVLGRKNSQDAWHITTAERSDCYCFLTMDFQLIRNMRAQSNNKIIRALKTQVLTPEKFGQKFSIGAIRPRLFSYHGASFPVIHNENWPDSKRQKHRRKALD